MLVLPSTRSMRPSVCNSTGNPDDRGSATTMARVMLGIRPCHGYFGWWR